jgi:YaiO family outer membrane protein
MKIHLNPNRVSFVVALFFTAFCTAKAEAQLTDSLPNTITIGHEYTHFDLQFRDDWQLSSLEYKRQTQSGAYLARFNHANRFGRTGWQAEAEAYPKLSSKIYAYLSVGYAPSVPVFPKWRTGTSLFFVLPKGWEAEAGFRHLRFSSDVWVGTAGFSKYVGNWLFNIRSFASSSRPAANYSVFFNARRYLSNPASYLWLQVGRGTSPDETRNVLLGESAVLSSMRMLGGTQLALSKFHTLGAQIGWSQDDIGQARKGNQVSGSLRLGFRFH